MTQQDEPLMAASAGELTAAQAMQQLVQFIRVVRYRKHVVLLTLAASALLAGLY